MDDVITGTTAAEIADSVRSLRERGMLRPGDALPPVRELAARLGVNRNTAVSAYRQLAQAGLVVSRGRAGTVVAGAETFAQEGVAHDTVLQDVGSGNPDPRLIPDPTPALGRIVGRPVLYGEPVIDAGLEAWAEEWARADLGRDDLRISVTSGAVDAVERLLAQALLRDDAVALEDPCFLASIHTVRLGGYRAVPVPVDDEGMTVDGLRAALDAGVRAVICTPRAQNPTGVSLSPARAAALREVLAAHPYVLVIEDDHFSLLSQHPYATLIGPGHRRYALVRSVSKFLGPDMCLAIAATDPTTAERLAMRLSPGTTWVSHLLQRLAHAQLTDPQVRQRIDAAGRHYADRNAAFAAGLAARGIRTSSADGLSLWVELDVPARRAAEALMRRGWLARTGDEFRLDDAGPASRHLRLTVHDLDDEAAERLLDDLAAAAR
ncbi:MULTISPECIES: aminotransferase class I/II-fold pyridoxal phosphate-dependent enzyme [Microbacterium]|uniref:aminotransferase class I/II-fold pyridoxal phosphate-dependent enzyme n=1 Tax=Microbacterium TaxID=33882 RepID=UPI00217D3F72|nr:MULTISPECIES: aminotransferase class I/II-fold pyridoxal phosphate-dependent enzyme [Microbacterium]UWF76514.1 aminotransferase class I/II-fold pyridoxal phosphate-dependent enzyme [Microbacterium neungamense]WCM54666.1 aminotransferase class I/II-fold pyridoxal phosphate-dependent enzyme [Microbacterium sp. EF45047]